jgi:hypothetical protein
VKSLGVGARRIIALQAWAAIMAHVDREASPPTIPSFMQRMTTISNRFRDRSLSRKPAVTVLGKRRMIGNVAVEPQPTKPGDRIGYHNPLLDLTSVEVAAARAE